MKTHRSYQSLSVIVLALAVQKPLYASDTILLHGHIYTGNTKMPWAEALAITRTRIDAVGTDKEVAGRRRAGTKVIDLQGRTVIPGIVDSHAHVVFGSYALHGLNLSTPDSSITPDKRELITARLQSFAQSQPADTVLFARADFSATPPSTPHKELLDLAVPDRPLVVHNSSEHALWVNTAALRMAGITDRAVANSQEERGIIRDASGRPSGVLLEAGMEVMERAVAQRVPVEEKLALLKAATRYLNTFGITSVVNATGNLDEIRLFAALRDRGELTVRTRTSFGAVAAAHQLTPEFLADLEEARRLYHDDWVSANLVKFFADGATGLIPPLVYTPDAYAAIVMELDRRGFQIMTHAARDDSVHMILDTYERVEQAHGPRDRRLRIEHADLTDEADIARFAKLSVSVVMQPAFCCAEQGLNYDLDHPLPTDRWKSFETSGTRIAFSSDWPCTWPPDPFVGIQAAATRQVWRSPDTADIAGNPLDGAANGGARLTGAVYVPAERISVAEAINAYTQGSAYAAFMDDRVGTLEVGKQADLAVLSQDPFAVPREAIAQTRVLTTMVAGKIVYSSAPGDGKGKQQRAVKGGGHGEEENIKASHKVSGSGI
jgi:predicted amidohydrolase YtcJ